MSFFLPMCKSSFKSSILIPPFLRLSVRPSLRCIQGPAACCLQRRSACQPPAESRRCLFTCHYGWGGADIKAVSCCMTRHPLVGRPPAVWANSSRLNSTLTRSVKSLLTWNHQRSPVSSEWWSKRGEGRSSGVCWYMSESTNTPHQNLKTSWKLYKFTFYTIGP